MIRNRKRNYIKVGSLRVWVMDRIPCDNPVYYPVKSPAHGKRLIDALAESQLLDPNITENAFGLERMVANGVWEDWTDEDGNGIFDFDACVVSEEI